MNRKTKIILILGVRGCGKSTYAEHLAHTNPRALMVVPTWDDWADKLPECKCRTRKDFEYTGVRCRVYENENDFVAIGKHLHDAVLVLDDPRAYIGSNFDHSALKKIIIVSRKMMLDIVFVAHGFRDIPPVLFSFVTDYVLFNVFDEPKIRKDRIPPNILEKLEKIVTEVRQQAKTNPYAKKHIAVE
ncbi:MAG: hypothetical protein FWC39_07360 [Bacteroidetes bacterium]|nr:hypothetical protein [Bacteroidota bacterium]